MLKQAAIGRNVPLRDIELASESQVTVLYFARLEGTRDVKLGCRGIIQFDWLWEALDSYRFPSLKISPPLLPVLREGAPPTTLCRI